MRAGVWKEAEDILQMVEMVRVTLMEVVVGKEAGNDEGA